MCSQQCRCDWAVCRAVIIIMECSLPVFHLCQTVCKEFNFSLITFESDCPANDHSMLIGLFSSLSLFLSFTLELEFACVRPSVIAAACVATAVRGILQRAQCSHSIASTFAFFSAQLQIDIDSVSSCTMSLFAILISFFFYFLVQLLTTFNLFFHYHLIYRKASDII